MTKFNVITRSRFVLLALVLSVLLALYYSGIGFEIERTRTLFLQALRRNDPALANRLCDARSLRVESTTGGRYLLHIKHHDTWMPWPINPGVTPAEIEQHVLPPTASNWLSLWGPHPFGRPDSIWMGQLALSANGLIEFSTSELE